MIYIPAHIKQADTNTPGHLWLRCVDADTGEMIEKVMSVDVEAGVAMIHLGQPGWRELTEVRGNYRIEVMEEHYEELHELIGETSG